MIVSLATGKIPNGGRGGGEAGGGGGVGAAAQVNKPYPQNVKNVNMIFHSSESKRA